MNCMDDNCRKIQDNEKLAIQSIYKKEARFEVNAWEIWTPLSVTLTITRIYSTSWDEITKVSIELRVVCSANYPQIPPKVSLLNAKGISKELVQVLQKNLKDKCKSLIGSAMILKLCSEVQNFLYENTNTKQVDLDAGGSGNSRFGPWHIDENSRLMYDCIFMKKLGSGGFGDVLLARNEVDDGNYAIKRTSLYAQSEELNSRIIKEAKLFSKLNHPNVVRYYSAWTENAKKKESDDDDLIYFERNAQGFSRETEESEDVASSPKLGSLASGTSQETLLTATTREMSPTRFLYIQMEFCGRGTLRSLIDAKGLVGKAKNVWRIFRQILAGLSYIHKEGMIHRDIKPMNILIDEKDRIKIGDFGHAARDFFHKMDSTSAQLEVNSKVSGQTKDYIGTELYKAPELFDADDPAPYSSKIDVYSTGVVLFEMFYRPLPLGMERNSTINRLRKNIAIPSDFGQEYPQNQQSLAKIFVTMMLQENAENRPTVDQLLDERIDVDGEELGGREANTSVLILGGGYSNTIYLLDSKAQSWKKLSTTLPAGMRAFGAVVLYEEIYIFGGYSKDCYKLKDDGSWMKLAPLNQERSAIFSSSLVYKGDIWVIGGDSRLFGSSLKSVEKYDISQDKWTNMPEMTYPRKDAAAVVFKDRIFVTGGENEKILKSVEIFDPVLQKWIFFCDLPIKVTSHTMLISNSTLSIFGGKSESGRLNSVWEMDIEDPKKKWTEKQSFKHSRSDFGIGKLSNGIIVFDDETSEIFDGNEWIDGPKLPQRLTKFAYTSIPRSLEQKLKIQFVPIAAKSANTFEKQNTSVLILGGVGYLDTIYLLDSMAQSWKKLSITLPVEMFGFGAVVLNEEIYIFGGIAKGYQQDCYKLKDDGSWMKLTPLNQKRAHISSSSLVYKGDIWVIAGVNGNYLKSVEKYNILQDKWTYMPEMNYTRQNAAAVVFKDRIFVTGGRNKKRLKSVEMFDPVLQKWIFFCNLPIKVISHTMLISNSTLSIFGGESESGRLNSVWEMDIEDLKKKWTEKQSFKHPRSDFGIGKLSNGITVFGGWDESGETSEMFDGNEWIDGPKLPQRLTKFAYTSIPRSLEQKLKMQSVQNAAKSANTFEKQNTSILILDGYEFLARIYLLDSKAQSWKKLKITLPMGLFGFGAVVLYEEIYIFGGYFKDCYKLKDDGSWMKLAPLNQERSAIFSSSLVYKGDIWVIGGDSQASLKSVEKYDISQDKWTSMAEMNYARSDAAAAVFKDRIFVTGGRNKKRLKSVEMFDPVLQKWIFFCDLPIEIHGHTMLISNSTLSIFGGYSESGRLNSVWEMDIEDLKKKWTEKQSFKHPRSDFGIGKLSNGITVFGGWNESGETSEMFDGNEWIDGPKLPQRLTKFAYTSIPRSLEESLLEQYSSIRYTLFSYPLLPIRNQV